MGATTTLPARLAAGSSTSASFRAVKVTVRSARTEGPAISGESESSPDGTSTEATYARARLIQSTTAAKSGPSGLLSPVPKSASMIVSARSRPARSAGEAALWTSRPSAEMISQFVRASPRRPAGSANNSTTGRAPRSERWRAATRPSPPLLPLPQNTWIGRE